MDILDMFKHHLLSLCYNVVRKTPFLIFHMIKNTYTVGDDEFGVVGHCIVSDVLSHLMMREWPWSHFPIALTNDCNYLIDDAEGRKAPLYFVSESFAALPPNVMIAELIRVELMNTKDLSGLSDIGRLEQEISLDALMWDRGYGESLLEYCRICLEILSHKLAADELSIYFLQQRINTMEYKQNMSPIILPEEQ